MCVLCPVYMPYSFKYLVGTRCQGQRLISDEGNTVASLYREATVQSRNKGIRTELLFQRYWVGKGHTFGFACTGILATLTCEL